MRSVTLRARTACLRNYFGSGLPELVREEDGGCQNLLRIWRVETLHHLVGNNTGQDEPCEFQMIMARRFGPVFFTISRRLVPLPLYIPEAFIYCFAVSNVSIACNSHSGPARPFSAQELVWLMPLENTPVS